MVKALRPIKFPVVLQPFARGDTARGSEGTGLGLAIVQRIVDQHAGKLILSNRPQGGLRVEIRLPVTVNR